MASPIVSFSSGRLAFCSLLGEASAPVPETSWYGPLPDGPSGEAEELSGVRRKVTERPS